MKKLMMFCSMLLAANVFAALPDGGPYTETVDGIEWTFTVVDGRARIQFACPVKNDVTVPSTLGGARVTALDGTVFYKTDDVTSVNIPGGVSEIGSGAFYKCTSLKTIELPSTVTTIGHNAFYETESLQTIRIDANNGHFTCVDGVLYDKDMTKVIRCPVNKKSYAFPKSIKRIGSSAFTCCKMLKSLDIPEGVEIVGTEAFHHCTSISSIRIPSTVGSIGLQEDFVPDDNIFQSTCEGSAFRDMTSLKEIIVDSGNKNYVSVDGVLYSSDVMTIFSCPPQKKTVSIPDTVTIVADRSFEHCANLTAVTLPKNTTYIGSIAFYGCSGLTSIDIPETVEHICGRAFYYCSGLKTVIIPPKVTELTDRAFADTGIQSVTIPPSVVKIDKDVFKNCSNWQTVYVSKGDVARVRNLLSDAGYDISKLTFIEGSDPTPTPKPEQEDSFETAHTFNGLVTDEFGMCGMIQVATAKKSAKGEVRVSGFVMLEDGKKQSLKAATGTVSGGTVSVTTKVGKLGELALTITDDGFTGTLGEITVASEDIGEETGIISGTLKMSYFDAKTGKVKTKSITIKGLTNGVAAEGSAAVKGQAEKSFTAEITD